MRPDKVTRQTILPLGDTAYAGKPRLPDDVRLAVWAMVVGRTAVLGGHLQACPDGQVERIWDHSCRHRRCPPGAWVQIARGLAKPKGRLLAGEPDHVICTMPHELNARWWANVEGMSGMVFASGHDTRVELRGERTYVGATPGISAPRQTWSQTLSLPPPLHGLVSGGGLRATGQGVVVPHGLRWPMRGVMALVRGQLWAAIRQEWAHGRLQRPPGTRPPPRDHRRNPRGRQPWHVLSRARAPHGAGVLIDRARDRRGGPRSPRRLLACEGQPVVCRDDERAQGPGGQAKPGTRRLPLAPFVGRCRRPVPPPHAVRVRCWGL